MRHWNLIGEAAIPGSPRRLQLHRGKDDFHISLTGGGGELMNTRQHASEDALGDLPCRRIAEPESARVLIGGLGMGFTLAAALKALGPGAVVTVAELIPEVIEWNRGALGACSGHPLDDPRTRVHEGDVAELLQGSSRRWNVIALDVDNGPDGLTQAANDALYTTAGITMALGVLAPGGVLAYWSAGPDRAFRDRLNRCGLEVDEVTVRAHAGKGARHTIWLARAR